MTYFRIFKFVLIFLILKSSSAGAIVEKDLENSLTNFVEPFLKENTVQSEFVGHNNAKIRFLFMANSNPLGAIIISPGKGEAAVKYAELLYDIRSWGYDVYVINHRSQGTSDRSLANPNIVHVQHFSDYVNDFTYLVEEIVKPKGYKNIFVLGHSMGGAIASGYVKSHPKAISGLILSAPMFEIKFAKGEFLSGVALGIMAGVGRTESIAPGQESDVNDVTSSEVRYRLAQQIDKLYAIPKPTVVSVNWIRQSMKYTQELRESKQSIFDVPTILLQAQNDQIVSPNGQNTVCKIPCQIIPIAGAQHEVLMETDLIRDIALQTINNFITSIVSRN